MNFVRNPPLIDPDGVGSREYGGGTLSVWMLSEGIPSNVLLSGSSVKSALGSKVGCEARLDVRLRVNKPLMKFGMIRS